MCFKLNNDKNFRIVAHKHCVQLSKQKLNRMNYLGALKALQTLNAR